MMNDKFINGLHPMIKDELLKINNLQLNSRNKFFTDNLPKTDKQFIGINDFYIMQSHKMIPFNLYDKINKLHYMPIKYGNMCNYWEYKNYKNRETVFKFILCKKVEDSSFKINTEIDYEDNKYDEYFIIFDDKDNIIHEVLNTNNHFKYDILARFYCEIEIDNKKILRLYDTYNYPYYKYFYVNIINKI